MNLSHKNGKGLFGDEAAPARRGQVGKGSVEISARGLAFQLLFLPRCRRMKKLAGRVEDARHACVVWEHCQRLRRGRVRFKPTEYGRHVFLSKNGVKLCLIRPRSRRRDNEIHVKHCLALPQGILPRAGLSYHFDNRILLHQRRGKRRRFGLTNMICAEIVSRNIIEVQDVWIDDAQMTDTGFDEHARHARTESASTSKCAPFAS